MFSLIGLIKAAFVGIGNVFDFLKTKKLLDAGAATERDKVQSQTIKNVEKAHEARDSVNDPDTLERLRSKYTRD